MRIPIPWAPTSALIIRAFLQRFHRACVRFEEYHVGRRLATVSDSLLYPDAYSWPPVSHATKIRFKLFLAITKIEWRNKVESIRTHFHK